MKACTKCGECKPLDAFPPRPNTPCGLYPQCRVCVSTRAKARYQCQRERLLDLMRINAQRDPERRKRISRESRRRRVERDPEVGKRVNAHARETLSDGYVRGLLAAHGCSGIRDSLPAELVNLKREQIRLQRLAKAMKQAAKENA